MWILAGWLVAANVVTFAMFGWDKWRARREKSRVPEFTLCLWGALGGWPGGWVAMLLFRHKTAKPSFLIKYSLALLVCAGWLYLTWRRLSTGSA
jgi:uncharacterized membrane protein YsdA (DUF1294 family)